MQHDAHVTARNNEAVYGWYEAARVLDIPVSTVGRVWTLMQKLYNQG